MRDEDTIEVLGVQMYNKDPVTFTDHVLSIISENGFRANRCVSATGAHGIIYAKKHPSFKALLNNFYANIPDGMPGVWIGRGKGAKDMKRCYGPDLFDHILSASAGRKINHYLCGGKKGVAERLKEVCEDQFGNHNVVGTYCPPFKKVDEYDYMKIANDINQSGADIVWVGISTPKQEKFASRLSKFTEVHFLITVGAAFDFHIGEVRQAPSWMQNLGLEWFFRLLTEPRRLFRRYLEIVPTFFLFGILDLLQFRLNQTRKH